MQRLTLWLFVAAVIISPFLPTDETLWHALGRVALTVWVVRHLKRDYDDFVETINSGKRRR